jgi:hypothetical protein
MTVIAIRVSPARRVHILDGDTTGGGHGPGRGISGKSEFPTTLTDDDIIQGVEAIANDPAAYPGGSIPIGGARVRIVGMIVAVRTVVIVDPAAREVVSAWPEGVPRNP